MDETESFSIKYLIAIPSYAVGIDMNPTFAIFLIIFCPFKISHSKRPDRIPFRFPHHASEKR